MRIDAISAIATNSVAIDDSGKRHPIVALASIRKPGPPPGSELGLVVFDAENSTLKMLAMSEVTLEDRR